MIVGISLKDCNVITFLLNSAAKSTHLSLQATWRSFLPLSTSFIISDQSGRLRGRVLQIEAFQNYGHPLAGRPMNPLPQTPVRGSAGIPTLLSSLNSPELLESLFLRIAEHALLSGRQRRGRRWGSLGHQRGQRRWGGNWNNKTQNAPGGGPGVIFRQNRSRSTAVVVEKVGPRVGRWALEQIAWRCVHSRLLNIILI